MTDKSPSMPFYGKDAYDDEAFNRLTFGGQGFFTWLAWWQWREGSIPSDVEAIFDKVPRKHIGEAKKLWEIVEPFFPICGDGSRRRNGTTQKHRDKMLARRERYQDGADSTNARRYPDNTSLGVPQSIGKGIVIVNQSKESNESIEANRNEINLIRVDFDSRPEPRPTNEFIAEWLAAIGLRELLALLAKYPDKNAAYIAKCIESRQRELAKNLVQMQVGVNNWNAGKGALELLNERIEKYEMEHPRPLRRENRTDWNAAFEAQFGFTVEQWNEAWQSGDNESAENWMRSV